jgi:hypothetical protein
MENFKERLERNKISYGVYSQSFRCLKYKTYAKVYCKFMPVENFKKITLNGESYDNILTLSNFGIFFNKNPFNAASKYLKIKFKGKLPTKKDVSNLYILKTFLYIIIIKIVPH